MYNFKYIEIYTKIQFIKCCPTSWWKAQACRNLINQQLLTRTYLCKTAYLASKPTAVFFAKCVILKIHNYPKLKTGA